MVKKHLLAILALIAAAGLFIGGQTARIKRAEVLSRTFYYPFFAVLKHYATKADLKEQNTALRTTVASLRLENAHLANLLRRWQTSDFTFENPPAEFVLADVNGYTGTFTERDVLINRGRLAGVKPNMPVLAHNGVAGKVISASLGHAVVLPLIHTRFKAAIMTKRARVQGMLETGADGILVMTLIKTGSDVAIADTVITSNLSTLFPKGLPVGVVVKISDSQSRSYLKAEIKPFVDTANLENVAVLLPGKDNPYENF